MSDRILVGTRKGLFSIERGKNGWAIAGTQFLGDNVAITMADPRDEKVYAALGHGHFGVKMHRADSFDGTWEEFDPPAYPEKPADADDVDMWGKPLEWVNQGAWALEPGGPDEPGVLWCGTFPGGLFKSEDGGETWALNRALWDHPKRKTWMGAGADVPGLHSICVDPRNSKHLTIAVSTGSVWRTEDGGASWEVRGDGLWGAYTPPDQADDPAVQDVHRLVQCRSHPDVLWAQHHNAVFRSRDGGRKWDDIKNAKPSVFGFAVAVHPNQPDTAWFVPAIKDEKRIPVDGKLVVSRTRDGGETFEVLRKGLPQKHAYDLVWRHGLAIDDTGDRLAFGSTTGGFWISEDQGDSWACVSQNLPPVACVRFG